MILIICTLAIPLGIFIRHTYISYLRLNALTEELDKYSYESCGVEDASNDKELK